jgi:hypothetical protein
MHFYIFDISNVDPKSESVEYRGYIIRHYQGSHTLFPNLTLLEIMHSQFIRTSNEDVLLIR